jgi:hypothetical protein
VADPLCIGLPSTRDDARLLTHADAAAMAAQLPDNDHPAPGAGGLPLPRTVVEAMSMLAYSRQQERWHTSNQHTRTHSTHPNHTPVHLAASGIHPSRLAQAPPFHTGATSCKPVPQTQQFARNPH